MWFKVDDHLHASRKTAKAGTAAMGLWVLAGSWSAAEELDGFVPYYMVRALGGDSDMSDALVAAGLWVTDTHDGEDGYRFHAWDEYQPTRASLEAKREAQRERMRDARAKGGDRARSVRAHNTRSDDAVTPTPSRPVPTPNNTTAHAADFADWWTAYPRKIGKTAAAKAYTKARKTVDAATLTTGLANAVAAWQASRTEERFIPHASTWLNEGRWDDEQPLPGVPAAPQGPAKVAHQCEDREAHPRHDWHDARTSAPYVCMGA